MPNKVGKLQTSRTPRLVFENEGEMIVLLNPAPYLTVTELQEAEEAGQAVEHHRENTGWYLTVPGLNITLPIEVEGGLLKGYVAKDDLKRMADDLITQLKLLSSDALAELQTVVHDFATWPSEARRGQLYFSLVLNNDD